jgi:hypothetical protein
MRTSRTKVTSRTCNRDFSVILGAIKASRACRATLLPRVGVVVASEAPQCAAGSIAAICSCATHGTTNHIFRSRRHCPSSAYVPARALTKFSITRIRNTSTVTRSTKGGGVAYNARHQSVGGWGIPAMYVVGC